MIETGDLKRGSTIELDGNLYSVIEVDHIKMGRGSAQVRMKLRDVRAGHIIDKSVQAGTRFTRARVERQPAQYLYAEGNLHYFMNTETYDQVQIPRVTLEEFAGYLKDGMTLAVLMRDGEIVTIDFPQMVELEIVETEDAAARGDTARAFQKRARVETGAEVMVPGFIKLGDRVKIDTTTGKYVERV